MTQLAADLSPSLKPGQSRRTAPIGVVLVGLGTVGAGVFQLLARRPELTVKGVVVRDPAKYQDVEGLDASLLGTDLSPLLRDPSVDMVIELAGGVGRVKDWVEAAIKAGKHVVTANKELIAKHGQALLQLAQDHQVSLLFEGAVAGGIPIVLPLCQSLAANRVLEIAGILNGTTNYILTRMTEDGWDLETALKKAQDKGFAEADPTNDVDGFDAAYKIAILASLALEQSVPVDQLSIEGIRHITPTDIDFAKRFGFTIRLVGLARLAQAETAGADIRVHPVLVPNDHPLASIKNEYNAVFVRGDALGPSMFYGKGAGQLPTASAVVADVLAVVKDLQVGNRPVTAMARTLSGQARLMPIEQTVNRYYIRLNTLDEPGVIAQLGQAFGDHQVSLESFWQQPGEEPETASLILVTHEVSEENLRRSLERIGQLKSTRSIGCVLRVL